MEQNINVSDICYLLSEVKCSKSDKRGKISRRYETSGYAVLWMAGAEHVCWYKIAYGYVQSDHVSGNFGSEEVWIGVNMK